MCSIYRFAVSQVKHKIFCSQDPHPESPTGENDPHRSISLPIPHHSTALKHTHTHTQSCYSPTSLHSTAHTDTHSHRDTGTQTQTQLLFMKSLKSDITHTKTH